MDALMQATIDFEVAIDDFAAATYGQSIAREPFLFQKAVGEAHYAIVETAVAVALAMDDADVSGAGAAKAIPAAVAADAAEAEIAALHGSAKLVKKTRCERCAGTGQFVTYVENGVPKGPGGPCFRCGGKGVQTVDDRKRNYGYDNFGMRVSA